MSLKDKMVPCGCVWSAWRLTNASEPPRDFGTPRVQLDRRLELFATYDRRFFLNYVSLACVFGFASLGHWHVCPALLVAVDGA